MVVIGIVTLLLVGLPFERTGDLGTVASFLVPSLTSAAIFAIFCVGLHVQWGYVWLVAFGACIFLQGPFTVLSGRLLFSDRPTVLEVLGATFRRTLPYALLLLARAVLLVVFAVTLLGPFVVLVYGAFLHEVVLLESAGIKSALGRSRRFVRGRSGSARRW